MSVRSVAETPIEPGAPSLRERFDLRRFILGERATVGPIELTHRRVFILPTRRGFGLALLLFLQFLVAINYNNNLAFMLTFLMAGVAMVSLVYSFRNLAGLSLRSGKSKPVFAGDPAVFELHCDNRSRLPRSRLQARLRGCEELVAFDVNAESTAVIRFRAAAVRRGWLDLGTITFSTGFPLGLFRAWSPVNLSHRTLIYPRPAVAGSPAPPTPDALLDGSQQLADGDDFFGFSTYQPGDPLRRVHWKGVAKGQGAHLKRYRGAQLAECELDWRATPGQDVESRLSLLCRWVLDAEQAGSPYSLRLPGRFIQKGIDASHRHQCLEALALFAP